MFLARCCTPSAKFHFTRIVGVALRVRLSVTAESFYLFNPFTSHGDSLSQKIPNLISFWETLDQQEVPCKNTAEECLFELPHHTISSTDEKVRSVLYSIINSTTRKFCSKAFVWMVTQRISSTDSKVRTTLYSIINSTTGKYCSVAFIWMVTPWDFIHRLKS